jgi:hypothetical protein
MKTIKFYKRNVWGKNVEYVLDQGDAQIIKQLTGQITINSVIRELFRDISAGQIRWEQVIAPD